MELKNVVHIAILVITYLLGYWTGSHDNGEE